MSRWPGNSGSPRAASTMPPVLDYAHGPQPARRSKLLLAELARVTLLLPLVLLIAFHVEWVVTSVSMVEVASRTTGVSPVSWANKITVLVLVAAVPLAVASFAINLLNVLVNRPPARRTAAMFCCLLVCWLALYAFMRYDPGGVIGRCFD